VTALPDGAGLIDRRQKAEIVRAHQKHAIPIQPDLMPWCEMAIELRT
jgi:hypothetical protein